MRLQQLNSGSGCSSRRLSGCFTHRTRPPRRILCSSTPSGGGSTSSGSDEQSTQRLPVGSVVYRAKGASVRQPPFPLTVPLLPFPSGDVLPPGATKILHLYEARYLALLEKVLTADHQVFCHVLVEQPVDPGSSSSARLPGALVGDNFVLALGTLVQVVEVKAQGVGALVRVQAEGRIKVESLKQLEPYIIGTVSPLTDDPVPQASIEPVLKSADSLSGVLRECSDLCAKFGGMEAAALQQAILWTERRPLLPGIAHSPAQRGEADALDRAHRIAWAALSAMPQASESELRQLLRFRLAAMASTSSVDRVQLATSCLESARNMLAARVALKSLNIGAS